MSDNTFDYKSLQEDLSAHQNSQFGGSPGDAGLPPPYNPSYGFVPAPPPGPAVALSPQPQVVNVVTHQFAPGPSSYGRDSMRIQCPNCQQNIMTDVSRKSVCKTHCWACFLFLCLCWPCICVPYCCAGCKDAYHSCPNCKSDLGVYRT